MIKNENKYIDNKYKFKDYSLNNNFMTNIKLSIIENDYNKEKLSIKKNKKLQNNNKILNSTIKPSNLKRSKSNITLDNIKISHPINLFNDSNTIKGIYHHQIKNKN